jgi:DNA-binding protein YbaB
VDPENAALQEHADQLRADFQRLMADGPAVAARARQVVVTRRSRDGLVSVTVGPRGDLVHLDIDPRVYRRPDSRGLADSIVETVQAAAQEAQEQVVETLSTVIPREAVEAQLSGDLEGYLDQMTDRMLGKG